MVGCQCVQSQKSTKYIDWKLFTVRSNNWPFEQLLCIGGLCLTTCNQVASGAESQLVRTVYVNNMVALRSFKSNLTLFLWPNKLNNAKGNVKGNARSDHIICICVLDIRSFMPRLSERTKAIKLKGCQWNRADHLNEAKYKTMVSNHVQNYGKAHGGLSTGFSFDFRAL